MTQYVYPASDITAQWTPSAGSTHFGVIDEASYSDADYVSTQTQGKIFECKFSALADPQSSTGHILRIRAYAAGSSSAEKLTYALYQGATAIHTASSISITRNSFNEYSFTLSAAEADAITDYTDLRVRVTAATLGTGETLRVSWAQLECPNVPSLQLVIQEASHAHAADSLALIQHNILVIQESIHAHAADSLALVQHNVLVIQEASHAQAADGVVLTYHDPSVQLVIQNAAHSHSADNVTLVQHNILAIQDALHQHGADNVTLFVLTPSSLVIQDALHNQSADNLVLTAHNSVSLIIQSSIHAHYADNIELGPLDVVYESFIYPYSISCKPTINRIKLDLTNASQIRFEFETPTNIADDVISHDHFFRVPRFNQTPKDGKLIYYPNDSDFQMPGTWKMRCWIYLNGKILISSWKKFRVEAR